MNDRIFNMSFSKVYPLLVAKAQKKNRTKEEVDIIIKWLTGYSQDELESILNDGTNFHNFFENAPMLNPLRVNIKGVICGVRIEEISNQLMKEIRYLDKLIDELARGKSLEKILDR
jgi:hypothetical protein